MKEVSTKNESFLYPPGGILIWIIVLVELITFGMALIVFRHDFHQNYDTFLASQSILSKNIGLFNTIILITSGYFMASSLVYLKNDKTEKASLFLILTIVSGLVFLLVKAWEYSLKIESGHSFGSSDFFDYYWMLTGFHFIHVVLGIIILSILLYKLNKGEYSSSNYLDHEGGGVFWHMCDLIWILLFPVIYLLN